MIPTCDQIENIKEIKVHIDEITSRLHLGDLSLQDIGTSLQAHGEILERIELQVKTTNGRVTKLEKLRTIIVGIVIGTAIATTSGPGILRAIFSAVGK